MSNRARALMCNARDMMEQGEVRVSWLKKVFGGPQLTAEERAAAERATAERVAAERATELDFGLNMVAVLASVEWRTDELSALAKRLKGPRAERPDPEDEEARMILYHLNKIVSALHELVPPPRCAVMHKYLLWSAVGAADLARAMTNAVREPDRGGPPIPLTPLARDYYTNIERTTVEYYRLAKLYGWPTAKEVMPDEAAVNARVRSFVGTKDTDEMLNSVLQVLHAG